MDAGSVLNVISAAGNLFVSLAKSGHWRRFGLTGTSGAADIESVDGNIEILLVGCLFPSIEFSSFVDVLATCCAFHTERLRIQSQHEGMSQRPKHCCFRGGEDRLYIRPSIGRSALLDLLPWVLLCE